MQESRKFYPSHIDGFLADATACFAGKADAAHHYYQLKCICDCVYFTLYESDRDSVRAICSQCGATIVAYDLACYPSATKLAGEESFLAMIVPDDAASPTPVFIMYEYGGLDEDQAFDRNDITWCQVFIVQESGAIACAFDDETA
jgi:hypothetical protein